MHPLCKPGEKHSPPFCWEGAFQQSFPKGKFIFRERRGIPKSGKKSSGGDWKTYNVKLG